MVVLEGLNRGRFIAGARAREMQFPQIGSLHPFRLADVAVGCAYAFFSWSG